MKDILGNELQVGDRVAYARIGMGSDHGSLAIGTILEIKQRVHPYWANDHEMYEALVDWETTSDYARWPHIYHKPKKSRVTKFENMVKLNG